MSEEDTVRAGYKYIWSADAESGLTLSEFLAKYRPSMVQNDGTKPWIWVRGSVPETADNRREEASREAAKLLREVTKKVDDIKNDESIPVRSNKKTGTKSKKEVREQVQSEASTQLREISMKYGFVVGKWLIFAPPEKVDLIWSGIATSLVSGPLSKTSAFLTKVSTSPKEATAHVQHIICLYLPDVYNKEEVTEVMKVLLRNHGVNLSGVKSDLYTSISLDSKHPSGIHSTVWRNSALLPEAEIKRLKDEYFAELQDKPATSTPAAQAQDLVPHAPAQDGPGKVQGAAKPKLKRKVNDDPFASDDDNKGNEPGPTQAKEGKVGAAAQNVPHPETESGEETRKPAQKRRLTAARKKVVDDYFESDEEEKPKKKRGKT